MKLPPQIQIFVFVAFTSSLKQLARVLRIQHFKTFVWFEPTADMLQDSELRIELCSMSRIATFGDGVSFVEMPDRFEYCVEAATPKY